MYLISIKASKFGSFRRREVYILRYSHFCRLQNSKVRDRACGTPYFNSLYWHDFIWSCHYFQTTDFCFRRNTTCVSIHLSVNMYNGIQSARHGSIVDNCLTIVSELPRFHSISLCEHIYCPFLQIWKRRKVDLPKHSLYLLLKWLSNWLILQ